MVVVLSAVAGVGAAGVPVNVGEASSASVPVVEGRVTVLAAPRDATAFTVVLKVAPDELKFTLTGLSTAPRLAPVVPGQVPPGVIEPLSTMLVTAMPLAADHANSAPVDPRQTE